MTKLKVHSLSSNEEFSKGIIIPQILTERLGISDLYVRSSEVLNLAYLVCREFNFKSYQEYPEMCPPSYYFAKESYSFSCSRTVKTFQDCEISNEMTTSWCKITCSNESNIDAKCI